MGTFYIEDKGVWRPVANHVTTAGYSYLWNGYFGSTSPITGWYIGLIDNSGYSAVSVDDTMSSHAGWTEFQSYSGGVRPQWSPDAASSGLITNAAPNYVNFTLTANASIRGFFVTSSNVLGGTTGTLWCTALADAVMTRANGEIIKVIYEHELLSP